MDRFKNLFLAINSTSSHFQIVQTNHFKLSMVFPVLPDVDTPMYPPAEYRANMLSKKRL